MTGHYARNTKQKRIDGLWFMGHSLAPSKRMAQEPTNELRKNGYLARVIKEGKLWAVYYRPKTIGGKRFGTRRNR